MMVFNNHFRLEAEEFVVSVNNFGTIRMIEWGSKISTAICIRRFGTLWMVKKLRVTDKIKDFVVKFNESSRASDAPIAIVGI